MQETFAKCLKQSDIFAPCLDKYYYPHITIRNHTRNTDDIKMQFNGEDCSYTSGNTRCLNDEKAAFDWLNLTKYSFELYQNNERGERVKGWLLNDRKENCHYTFTFFDCPELYDENRYNVSVSRDATVLDKYKVNAYNFIVESDVLHDFVFSHTSMKVIDAIEKKYREKRDEWRQWCIDNKYTNYYSKRDFNDEKGFKYFYHFFTVKNGKMIPASEETLNIQFSRKDIRNLMVTGTNYTIYDVNDYLR